MVVLIGPVAVSGMQQRKTRMCGKSRLPLLAGREMIGVLGRVLPQHDGLKARCQPFLANQVGAGASSSKEVI